MGNKKLQEWQRERQHSVAIKSTAAAVRQPVFDRQPAFSCDLLVLQFLHLQHENNKSTYIIGLF